MAKIRKTSPYGKRKIKALPPIPDKVYPEYITNFTQEVFTKCGLKVNADQYSIDSGYNVGVLKKIGKVYRCIWMASYAKTKEELDKFWVSVAFADTINSK
jgi:hypothetical protein